MLVNQSAKRNAQLHNLVGGAAVCLVALLVLDARVAQADGLFYQLPEDGMSAKFDLEMKTEDGGEARDAKGSLRMSSVGKEDVDGEACRWIEFKMMMTMGEREQVILAKALMPEKELKRGGLPWDNFKKAWVKMGGGEAREIKEVVGNDAGPLPAFLSGPLKNEKELMVVEVESVIGKLKCGGLTGDVTLDDGNMKVKVSFENRLHEKAPFGVVTSKMTFSVERDGEKREGGTISLKLAEVKKDAKSEFADEE